MGKELCIFGSLFQAVRSQTTLSQWEISVRAGTHLSNVNQVEAGNQEPNVIIAVKMLLAANADIQSFFTSLSPHLFQSIESSKLPVLSQNEFKKKLNSALLPSDETKIFGILLSECRAATNLSQNCVSSIAKYDHRSLQRVEKAYKFPVSLMQQSLLLLPVLRLEYFLIFSAKSCKQ